MFKFSLGDRVYFKSSSWVPLKVDSKHWSSSESDLYPKGLSYNISNPYVYFSGVKEELIDEWKGSDYDYIMFYRHVEDDDSNNDKKEWCLAL